MRRPLRSLTVHYLRAPVERSGSIEVSVEREGRSVSFVQARLFQDGRLCAVAMAVLADGRDGISLEHAGAPDVAPPEELPEPPRRPDVPPFAERFEYRSAFSGDGNSALAGGWLRLLEPHPLDAALLVALCDAWIPPIFTVTREPVRVPTPRADRARARRRVVARRLGTGPLRHPDRPRRPTRGERRDLVARRPPAGPVAPAGARPLRQVCDIAQKLR